VLTQGVDVALAKSAGARAEVRSLALDVVDSVGAGDTFTAGLPRWLWSRDRLTPEAVGALGRDELEEALRLAAAVGRSTAPEPERPRPRLPSSAGSSPAGRRRAGSGVDPSTGRPAPQPPSEVVGSVPQLVILVSIEEA
jgi:fructokinase